MGRSCIGRPGHPARPVREIAGHNPGPESQPAHGFDQQQGDIAAGSETAVERGKRRLRALGICRLIYPAGARTTNHVEHILHLAWKDRDKKAEHALRNLLPEIRGYKR